MEEEKIVKRDEESISKEDYLKLKRSNDKNKTIIVVLIFIMVLMALILLLFFLNANNDTNKNVKDSSQQVNEKENNDGNNNTAINTNELKISEVNVTEETQEIILNSKKVSLATKGGYLYVNNKKLDIEDIEHSRIYSTGFILLIFTSNQSGYFINYGINEDGKLINSNFNYNRNDYYVVENSLQVENEKVMAKLESFSESLSCEEPGACPTGYPTYDAEIVYDGTNLSINKVN